MDATIIAVPRVTPKTRMENAIRNCYRGKKSNRHYLGVKIHISVDDSSGLMHHVNARRPT
ncbi:hypothetical protein [Xanthomonas euroxanthea]|uniref:hypothetical protein n=1 Tax=Xanthomonas euroxanthea TaxID=2259622 RepID=UPI003CCD9B0C